MEFSVSLGTVTYGYSPEFLLSLDIFSFDRLLEIAHRVKNAEYQNQAIILRQAFGGDEKQFKSLLDSLSSEDPREKESKKAKDGFNAIVKMFGGSRG